MAAHGRRKAYRGITEYNRQTDVSWRGPLQRSSSPGSPVLNGSPYSARRRDVLAHQIDREHEKNVNFLTQAWKTVETDIKNGSGNSTTYSPRNVSTQDFPPFDLDSFLHHLHQLQQQPHQQQT